MLASIDARGFSPACKKRLLSFVDPEGKKGRKHTTKLDEFMLDKNFVRGLDSIVYLLETKDDESANKEWTRHWKKASDNRQLEKRKSDRDESAMKKGPWSPEEHALFEAGLRKHGKGKWKEVAEMVGTRTCGQVNSHHGKWSKKRAADSNPASSPTASVDHKTSKRRRIETPAPANGNSSPAAVAVSKLPGTANGNSGPAAVAVPEF